MAEQNPLFADGITNGFNSQAMRLLLAASRQAGVVGATDLQVSAGGGTREILVAAGEGTVPDGNGGLYLVPNSASVSSSVFATVAAAGTAPAAPGPIPAAATNPRLDQIVARAWDDSLDSSSLKQWKLAVVVGTETSGVTLANRTGAGTLPTKSLLLADVITRPGMTTYPAVDIRDRRPWAAGANVSATDTMSADLTLPINTWTTIDASLARRAELSGAAVTVYLSGQVTGGDVLWRLLVDGVPFAGFGNATTQLPHSSVVTVPTSGVMELGNVLGTGSHLISHQLYSTAAATITHGTWRATIRETVRQSANNGLS